MRRILLLGVIPVARAIGAAAPLHAQAPGQQGGIMVPALSDQERWDRLSTLMVASFTAGIASYKALGKTAEDYGHYLGELFAPGWGAPNSGSAIPVARGGLFNYSSFRGSDAEFVSASDTAATIRFRRTHVAFFGAQRTAIGVSLDEYDQMTNAFNERLCAHLGLRCTIRNDGDWSYWTYTGRGGCGGVSPRDVQRHVRRAGRPKQRAARGNLGVRVGPERTVLGSPGRQGTGGGRIRVGPRPDRDQKRNRPVGLPGPGHLSVGSRSDDKCALLRPPRRRLRGSRSGPGLTKQ